MSIRRSSSRIRLFPMLGVLATLSIFAVGCDDDPVAPVVVDSVPPAAPQAVRTVTGDGRVTISWVPNTEFDLAGYRVFRGTTGYEGPFDPLSTTNTNSYVDYDVINGTTYYYAIAAYDAAGNESELSLENTFDTPRPAGTNLVLHDVSLEPDQLAGYDFSDGVRRLSGAPATDIYYEVFGGTRLMVARDLSTDVQDAGYRVLDELDWAPEEGWSPTGTVELITGHSYYVWTRTGNYAKFRVTSITDSQVRIDWAYQLQPDNPELLRTPRRDPLLATAGTLAGAAARAGSLR
jgi:hypothetical protein